MIGWDWLKILAASKDAALLMSLGLNVLLWKSREALQEKINSMLSELLRELVKITANLSEGKK